MRRGAFAVAILGLAAACGNAAEPLPLPHFTEVGHPAYAADAACGSCGSTGCAGQGRGGAARGQRCQKLIDFLMYRPSIPCDICPQPSAFVPPLYMQFPNTCNANGPCGCACTKPRRRTDRQVGCGACGTCAAGAPVATAMATKLPTTQAATTFAKAPTSRVQTPLLPVGRGAWAVRNSLSATPSNPQAATTPAAPASPVQPSGYYFLPRQ